MKAVIVETREKFAAALSDDGCIIKIKNKDYAIGQVIEMKKETAYKSKKLAVWATSAAAAIVVVCGAGTYAYATPYSYVSLDVNPSIEYSLNRFDRVLSVKAVNDDGSEIIDKIQSDLTNKKIDEAVSLTVQQISQEGYFDGEVDGGIVISTSAEDSVKADELAQELQQTVEEDTKDNGDDVQVEAISVGKERVEKARELGVTPGKLNLVEKLQASAADPESINIEEWLNKPVKEIMKATKENKKAEKATKKDKEKEQSEESSSSSSSEDASEAQSQTEMEKAASKTELAAEKASSKAQMEQEKASSKAQMEQEKASSKAQMEQEKASSKAQMEQEKASSKAQMEQEKASSKAQMEQEKENGKAEKESAKAEKSAGKESKSNGSNKK